MTLFIPADDTRWWLALDLRERLSTGDSLPFVIDRELAEKRFLRWRQETQLAGAALFAERLADAGCDEEIFRALLVESPETLRERTSVPSWLRHILDLYGPHHGERSSGAKMPRGSAQAASEVAFLDLLSPMLDDAWTRLRSAVDDLATRHQDLPYEPDTIPELLIDKLPGQLLGMIQRTLALELYISGLEDTLEGDTPSDRFRSFTDRLGTREHAREILRRYPVLARQAHQRIEQWLTVSLELLDRLRADQEALAATFSPGIPLGQVVELTSSLGDRHAGGRTVTQVGFSSGLRVIYKPRSLDIDVHFQSLLTWLDDNGAEPALRVLKILDRGDYGWVEFVEHRPCDSTAAVERFYRRQGALIALGYVLCATDLHHENVIASGENPVLVDLETLFHPREAGGDDAPAACSVLGSGLLPQRVSNKDEPGLDLSGLGSLAGSVVVKSDIVGAGTDNMHVINAQVEVGPSPNQPILDGERVPPWLMTQEIDSGFRGLYRFLQRHREDLLAPEGPLSDFADAKTRAILRPTSVYAHLLQASYHPDFLQDGLHRDRLFDRLWIDVEARPDLKPVLPEELREMQRGDVPRFQSRVSSRDLWCISSGRHFVEHYARSGMEAARKTLSKLNNEDMELQSWLVRAAVETVRPREEVVEAAEEIPLDVAPASIAEILDAARAIGDRLLALALRDERGQEVTWMHLQFDVPRKAWHLEPVGLDLYSGLSGITLFLAWLAEITDDARYRETARAAWDSARHRLTTAPASELTSLGAYTGWGGQIYAAIHLSNLWKDPRWLDEAHEQAVALGPEIAKDALYDIVGGAAGFAITLGLLHRYRPSAEIVELARRCGEHLLARAQGSEHGLSWPSKAEGGVALTGLAHGTAGFAWGLAEVAELTGESRFLDAARRAIAFERSWFSATEMNWPDLRADRTIDDEPSYFHAWCHGAPGIGLGRLSLLHQLPGDGVEDEIRAALDSTLLRGFGQSHCLCHGDFGNLDLVLNAAVLWEDADLEAQATMLVGAAIARSVHRGWRCGTSRNLEQPGLMVGLAGIGYGLLRAADPRRVPSILCLAPPNEYS